MKTIQKSILFILILFSISCNEIDLQNNDDVLKSGFNRIGNYFGELPPGDSAKVFAPGFISTSLYTRDIAFRPDGKEAYFCVSALGFNLIFETIQNEDQLWSVPKPASFIEDYSYMYYEPCISHDGSKMFFLSNMPDKDSIMNDQDIWCVDRNGKTWGKPYNPGEPINTEGSEFFPSLTNNNTLYFTRKPEGETKHYIYRSKYINGKFENPELLPEQVNIGDERFNAFISPQEDYIIVPAVGMENSYGDVDYFIVFRDSNDKWSNAINMGSQINSSARKEYSISLSYDGKYLFFMTDKKNSDSELKDMSLLNLVSKSKDILNGNANIWWIDAKIISSLKQIDAKEK